MAASYCTCMAWGIVPPASVVVLAPWACVVRPDPRTSRIRTCRARRRLLVRDGDLSCKAETCRGDPSCRELVGDAAIWPETGRLASVGLVRILSLPRPESWP
jgi:hypothetical protein